MPMLTRLMKQGWRRSKKGNLWQRVDETTLTVFARDEGGYRVCVYENDEPFYLPKTYYSETGAADAALEWLEERDSL